jgi:hypothetical protein
MQMEIRKISVLLIALFMIGALTTPVVFSATTDKLQISFDPDGDIDIDVNFANYNISDQVGPVLADSWTNTTGSTFTIYNNGTVAMDTQIQTNTSTDQGDMDLNASGTPPAQDEYAINITGLSNGWPVDTFVHIAYGVEFDQSLAPDGGTATFDLCLRIGPSLSANHSLQNTTLNFTGTQS